MKVPTLCQCWLEVIAVEEAAPLALARLLRNSRDGRANASRLGDLVVQRNNTFYEMPFVFGVSAEVYLRGQARTALRTFELYFAMMDSVVFC